MSILTSSLCEAASPRLARHYAEGNQHAFRLLLAKLAGAAAVIGLSAELAALLAGRPLLDLLYTPDFGAQVSVFCWLIVAAWLDATASFLSWG